MTLSELCLKRESVRDYQNREIENEKLNAVLEAVRLAPSACNRQPWMFYVCKSVQARQKAAECASRFPWVKTAPIVIICCIDHSQEWVRSYDGKRHGDIDIAIAVEHLCLAAAEQGLGTCWICAFDAAKCKTDFALPETLEPAVLIPLGYPDYDGQRDKVRKTLAEITEEL